MKLTMITLLIFLLIFIPFIKAEDIYSDCSVYGNCKDLNIIGSGGNTYNNNTYNNITIINGTSFNETYNNLLNQQCPEGQVVNGTYANGTFICRVAGTSSGGENNVAILNNVNTYNTVSNTDNRAYPSTALINNVITYQVNNVTGDILPTADSSYSIGSSVLRWLKGWFVNLDVSGDVNITGNIHIDGNFSARRAYWNGYDNSTQGSAGITVANVMNLSNNNDYYSWQINIIGNQNITFTSTGDYLCLVSPEFVNTGASADVGFWMQKNGVDVDWTNSRYSIGTNFYTAPAIPFQFDIENPATDNVRFMWWSSNANTILYSSGALSSPTRPSVPSVILNCQKVSEITP